MFYEDLGEYSRDGDGWKCEFHAASYAGVKLNSDLVNAETGKLLLRDRHEVDPAGNA